jgi:prepilin-type N-terminal cleavage/methylation domain-containing protein
MELHSILMLDKNRNSSGFTLIEILVSFSILAILACLGLFLSMDFFRGYSFDYERNILIAVLQDARSESLANINQANHGFCFDDTKKEYVIFQGDTCDLANLLNETFPASSIIDLEMREDSGPVQKIIFEQLNGDSASTTIQLSGNSKSAIIQINEEGRISW